MYRSPSPLAEAARSRLAETLNARLADGLDLHSQLKVAHWNVRGPQFPSLHPLFETMAERIVELQKPDGYWPPSLLAPEGSPPETSGTGFFTYGFAWGITRHVASVSRLPEYPQETTRDLEHVRLLAERIEVYLAGLRESRVLAEQEGDPDTVDLLTGAILEFEKHGWFLRASLAG